MFTALLLVSLFVVANAQAPSYAPTYVSCPSNGSLITRVGSPLDGSQKLSADEAAYISERREKLQPLWTTYLANDTGYNVSQIVSNEPKLAIAVSGGGLRASLYAAGTVSAMDSRNATNVGGLLQLADYFSGLSGGSWAVSSFALADLPTTYDLVLGNSNGLPGWKLQLDILAPGGVLGISENKDYYDILLEDVRAKAAVGAPISIVDLWGRALATHFLNGTTEANFYDTSDPHSQGLLWSSIQYTQNFQNRAMPMPLVVATSRISEANQVSGNSSTVIPLVNTQFEFTPYTLGSYDHTLLAQIPLTFAGTFLNAGNPMNSSSCVNDFDNAGFVMGTSAALFNAVQNEFSSPVITELISKLLADITDIQGTDMSVPLVANYPNSFYQFQPEGQGSAAFESNNNTILQLTDGGENGENVPIGPLLVKARQLDVIIAADSSADTNYFWPNGTSLLATAERVRDYSAGYTSFPPIPGSADDFVAQGLNLRPTFFGCNITTAANMSSQAAFPIVVYWPNAPPPNAGPSTYLTNTSTFQLNYDKDDVVSFLDAAHANGMKGFQNGSNTQDAEWPLALKCAVVDRARSRAMVNRSETCERLMNRYCWNDGIAETLTNITASTGGNLGGGGGAATPSSGASTLGVSVGAAVLAMAMALIA